jgi:hypothetical protein
MKSIVGIVLIVVALGLGYDGLNKFQDSAASIKVLGVEVSAEDTGRRQTAMIEMGLGVVSLLAGLYLLRSGRRG